MTRLAEVVLKDRYWPLEIAENYETYIWYKPLKLARQSISKSNIICMYIIDIIIFRQGIFYLLKKLLTEKTNCIKLEKDENISG